MNLYDKTKPCRQCTLRQPRGEGQPDICLLSGHTTEWERAVDLGPAKVNCGPEAKYFERKIA